MNGPHIICLICLLTAALSAANAEVPTGTETITLTPKFGTVTFSHGAHSQLEGVDCRTCHHTRVEPTTAIQPCHDCHAARHYRVAAVRPEDAPQAAPVPGQPPTAQEAFHALCQGCHAERKNAGQPAGPSDSCRDCHD